MTLSQESDDLDDSSINSSTLSSPVHSAKSEETVVYLSSEFSSASSDKNLRHFVGSGNGSAGGSSISTTSMAPLFTNQMQQLFGGLGQGKFLELVSMEVNHLAANLRVYAGDLNFMKLNKSFGIIFQKENGNTFTLFIIFIVKSLQKEQNSTNLLL